MPDQLPENEHQDQPEDRLQAIQQRAEVTRYQSDGTLQPRQKPIQLTSWISDSRVFDPKSPQWFLGLFIIGVFTVIALAVIREVMLILLVAAAIFVYYALARVRPIEVEHIIFNTGIKTGGRMYAWKEMTSFWFYQKLGTDILRLDTKFHFPNTIEILVQDEQVDEIKTILQRYLPMMEKPPSEIASMADNAFVTIAQKIPYQRKIINWVEHHI
jgi:hypothetical protein